MNQFRGVRRTALLLGLLACITYQGAAAATPPSLNAASINPHLDLRPPQWCVLDMARDFGKRIGLADTMQAIVLQESSAGDFRVNPDDPSYGVAGVLLSTAKTILGRAPTVDELMHDDELNLTVGTENLRECAADFSAWRRVLVCYNRGPAAATSMHQVDVDADDYVHKIAWRLQELQIYRKRASKCPRD